MKNMRFNKLKKHSNQYFKKKIGFVSPSEYTQNELRYIISRSYDALTKFDKRFIGNRRQILEVVMNQILVAGDVAKFNAYDMLKSYSEQQRTAKYPRLDFAKRVFKQFRQEYPSLYSKYNSYIYRLGYSSANYFYDNAEWSASGSIVTATLELPFKEEGTIYSKLEIIVDASDVGFIVAEMN